jgi:hypothetical protein
LQISQEIGYEEPTRWLLTEIANDQMVAGKWEEARQIVDELIPGFEEAPFWIEPQTRVCRARMLIAEGAVEAAVVDADRAVAAVQGNSAFQGLCNPLAFRARLHAELGETKDAARVTAEVVDAWEETRSAYVEAWVLDVWFAAWSAGEEARLTAAVAAFPIAVPWLDVVAAFIERDFGKAAARLESMAAISDAALARLWAGEWLVEEGRHADAAVQLERALPFWRSVGARRYLRRCESLLAAAS